MSTSTITIDLPPRFYDDHRSRDCGESGVVVKETKRFVRVTLDTVAYDDLKSDARYYADMYGDVDPNLFGVVASARATLKRLAKVERPS